MGIREFLIGNPGRIEITITMGFGCIVWLFAMRELLRKDKDTEVNNTVEYAGKKSSKQVIGTSLQLTYITKKQIMDLTAEQLKGIPESEVEKLPTAIKDMFKKRKNEVLLADRAKNSK
jgi:hypothetical protein